ncbi:MAG TPA: Asp-tRNA(Asn)/Glu-tRNA(Gln) amidotransferase subunit GatB [Methanothrix sp.]|jgi:aspartyl-tRNA(Asn)/glutamyl-tRNA(Gln) amidotransferase subunit B|uniref:Asp-tRNA(Asn)/Glu-tRNA(Gln) amidotransferase subunit GatB n=1 Tax=Methanothrix sp. TaxID=90426 RepID=UPI002C167B1F|nr:Asp-tRNA(Asn)/Glu-tRNA(Gln) amidotransferase subunit GatB [Methanothrix sp.]MDI9416901.1 Asp-tRNA(Asn)/Glu-tRNA(Gln) amidotransferase subunit GatB [Euryarchaeota archaeon]HON36442.1 Asp-tRNA(Asn)/Glu-tRNA(Gln) amidotransferase subunit GatB [Methanothrix sp.]HRU75420.1 Asp-tRNA(Asn)/Glu-tRNA(Gln) amidotransferase subunit GatB [Methanothrix sp.]
MDDVIIGLEIHVQLNRLESKMFCGCSTKYHNSPPNTHTCPVCLGLPGSLPVINRKAVESGIKVGLALNCHIEEETLFYRKNYYYPDLSKGFQISQYDYPLATNGHIMILGDDGIERNIRINRAHMEEDPGRLVHAGTIDRAKYTMVDYNRCGMSLLEVVTEPDLRSPKEARAFLDKLKSILEYLDVFDGSLEGAMRVDANISLRGGDRSEVKNISGFKGVEKALSYEITRQRNLARRNIKVVQETRHFDELRNITVSIRSKVGAHDYRYFPEADLVAMRIASWVPAIRDSLPELPDSRRERFVRQYGLTDDHAKSLTTEIKVADFYELVAARTAPKIAAVWIADVLKGELNYRNLGIESFDPEHMVQIVQLLEGDEITEHSAVAVIRDLLDKKGSSPQEIITSRGLGKAEDDVVEKAVAEAVAECSAAVADYRAGSERALNYIVGQVMKKTRGKASPGEVHDLVRAQVERL